ncbi:vitamin K epoxide reductase family protein [Candidatus Berkelbacteria bacterium]|nr:vitamin K epoxide reductase family protein [Candidatus Berkelbacteria bacterium]
MTKPTTLTAIALVALLGFADATYLTLEHYLGQIPPCTTSGCETVLTSQYAAIAGVPVALLGALYYLAVILLAIGAIPVDSAARRGLLRTIVSTGFVASLGFLYLQAFVINAYCLYCLGSLAITTILTGMVWLSPTLRRAG